MNNTNEIVDFFGEVQKAVSKYGMKKVLDQLKKLQFNLGEDKKSVVCRYIVTITANHYLVAKEDVVHSRKRGVVSDARRMCFALMKEHLQISDKAIGEYFDGRTKQYVNMELISLTINEDTFTSKHEKKFCEDFIALSIQVLKFRNSYEFKNISNE